MAKTITVLAGATGDLGGRIANCLLGRDASLRLLVRKRSRARRSTAFRNAGRR